MYILQINPRMSEDVSIGIQSVNISIPMNKDNTDYQQFVRDIKNGVQLKDAEGNQMTPEQITTFLETLP